MLSTLLKLFLMFAKLSLFSFGGGYVVISMLMKELETDKVIKLSELIEIIAIAGMSPGPVAVNSAVGLGYKIAGLPGVLSCFLGIAIPCSIVVILVAKFFFKMYEKPATQAFLYGLMPVTVGIILYSAANIAIKNGILLAQPGGIIADGINLAIKGVHLFEVKSIIIIVVSFLLLAKTRVHPVFIILGAGIAGLLVF